MILQQTQLIRKFPTNTDWCGAEIARTFRSVALRSIPSNIPRDVAINSVMNGIPEGKNTRNVQVPPLKLDERIEVNIEVQILTTKVFT